MAWTEENLLRAMGYLLIILGLLLITIFLIRVLVPTSYVCPGPGPCVYNPPMYAFSLFLGIFFVITGVILVIAARKMKAERETDNV